MSAPFCYAAQRPLRNQQGGMVLIVSLIFLTLMTIIGVTSMQGTTQSEKIGNNTSQRILAFQAAEAGLRAAEACVQTIAIATATTFDCEPSGYSGTPLTYASTVDHYADNTILGLHSAIIPSHDIATYWDRDYDWEATTVGADAGSRVADALDSTLTSPPPPRYVIERLQQLATPTTGGSGGDISASKPRVTVDAASGVYLYRLTARGVGRTSDAVVILQSLYVPVQPVSP